MEINYESETPIYMQIRNRIIADISSGKLKTGDRLPTVRQLAADSGINNMTVNKSYSVLKNEGFIVIDRRKGAKVNDISQIPKDNSYLPKLKDELAQIITEAGLKGVGQREFVSLCDRIYSEISQGNRMNQKKDFEVWL